MSIVQIEVKNWEKYNPKRDQKSYTWLRLDNSIGTDHELFNYSASQKYLWILILCEASKKNSASCVINLNFLSVISGMNIEEVTNTVELLSKSGFIKVTTESDRARSCNSIYTTPTNERTNERDERTNVREDAQNSRQTLRDEITDLELIDTWNQFFPEKIFPGLTLGAGKNRQNFEISVGFMPYKQNWVDLFQRCKNSKLAGLDPKFKCSWFNLIWILDHDNILKVQAGTFDTDEKTDEQLRQEDLEWAKNHSRKLQTV